MGGHAIPISETVKHLGILLSSSSNSTIERTTNRISSAKSSFYALSTIGARHSGINPVTSLTLFKSLSLPILSFGLEIWIPTDTELLLMERCQLKILRTILGLPTRSPSAGIHLLLGTIPVQVLSQLRRLSFIQSTAALPDSAIAKRLFLSCANSPSPGSQISRMGCRAGPDCDKVGDIFRGVEIAQRAIASIGVGRTVKRRGVGVERSYMKKETNSEKGEPCQGEIMAKVV